MAKIDINTVINGEYEVAVGNEYEVAPGKWGRLLPPTAELQNRVFKMAEEEGMTDLKGREITALVPIAALSIMLGLYPAPLLNVINPAVDWTMNTISAVDPEPVVSSDGSQP